MRQRLMIALLLVVSCSACSKLLRIQGSDPVQPRPRLTTVEPPREAYQVWVIVEEVHVAAYPQPEGSQQPLVQFTGDLARLKRGDGELGMLVTPTAWPAGKPVDYFSDKILWSGRLLARERRDFALWLRENQRAAPTPQDRRLEPLDKVTGVIEKVTGASGFTIPARQALRFSVAALKALQKDWLILRWHCPWRHVLDAARERMARDGRPVVTLRAPVTSKERYRGKPAARLAVLFVVQRISQPLPGERAPRPAAAR